MYLRRKLGLEPHQPRTVEPNGKKTLENWMKKNLGNRPIILMSSTLSQIFNMMLIKLPETEMSKDDLQQITNWNESTIGGL